jgi:hypothetical protein
VTRILELVYKWRFGALGSATAVVISLVAIGWTVADAAGFQGSPATLLLLLNVSMLIGFIVFHHLRLQHLLLVQRTSPLFAPGVRNLLEIDDDGNRTEGRIIGIVAPISSWATMFYVDIIRGICKLSAPLGQINDVK